MSPFKFACPVCRTPLDWISPDELVCPQDGSRYPREQGIWRCLVPERQSFFQPFIEDYETIRQAEGRGSDDPNYYRNLPFHSHAGRPATDWKIRSKSYRSFVKHILAPLERQGKSPLSILDLGAGNGWLSYRLGLRGHRAAAVDLTINSFDGLGAHTLYDISFTPVQAEFDRLPFTPGQFDLAIFNASLHYSTGYRETLGEALNALKPEGQIVILDTPVYHDPSSGVQMVKEREEHFRQAYGFPSNALLSENFLSFSRLEELGSQLVLSWQFQTPYYGLDWTLKPFKARLLGRREPAHFLVITGRRKAIT